MRLRVALKTLLIQKCLFRYPWIQFPNKIRKHQLFGFYQLLCVGQHPTQFYKSSLGQHIPEIEDACIVQKPCIAVNELVQPAVNGLWGKADKHAFAYRFFNYW